MIAVVYLVQYIRDNAAHVYRTWQRERQRMRKFGAEHPILVKTLMGDEYVIQNWVFCEDLRKELAKYGRAFF